MSPRALAALLALGALPACKKESAPEAARPVLTTAPASAAQPATAGQLSLSIPKEAVSEPVSSPMRAGQWRLPDGGSLVVFAFGAGEGGNAQQNIQRWCAMYLDASGKPVCDQSPSATRKVGSLDVTEVAFRGRYKTNDMMTGQAIDQPDQELVAAIILAPSGTFFVKLMGPASTVERYRPFFSQTLVPSLKLP